MDTLLGKVALVTGGGSGIGRGTAQALARAGAHVVVADIDEARARTVGQEVGGLGLVLDVNRLEDFDHARDVVLDRFGRIDIVMNNAGVLAVGLPEHLPLSEWERVLSTNLLSIVRSNATFLPLLLAAGSGHIVNTASTAGLYPYAYDRLPYASSKAAVISLSEGLALYLRPKGIGVTCLCPGSVATSIAEQMRFSGPPITMRRSGLPSVDPADVGRWVCAAILEDRFLVLTHPEVAGVLVERARDPEAFLARQVEQVNRPQ